VCNKDAHPLAFSLSLGFKMMQQSSIGSAKISMVQHFAPAIEKD